MINTHCRIGKVTPKATSVVNLKEYQARAALKKQITARGQHIPNPDVEAWLLANPWFMEDPALNALAIAIEHTLCIERPLLSERERLDEVRNELHKRFPEKFA